MGKIARDLPQAQKGNLTGWKQHKATEQYGAEQVFGSEGFSAFYPARFSHLHEFFHSNPPYFHLTAHSYKEKINFDIGQMSYFLKIILLSQL